MCGHLRLPWQRDAIHSLATQLVTHLYWRRTLFILQRLSRVDRITYLFVAIGQMDKFGGKGKEEKDGGRLEGGGWHLDPEQN